MTGTVDEARAALWAELLLDACASDGPIRDADVKNAIARYRPKIEAAVRAEYEAKLAALQDDERLGDALQAMTERESVTREDLTDIVDLIRPAISSAYYDARNAGETMEDAASRAAGAVLAILQAALAEARAAGYERGRDDGLIEARAAVEAIESPGYYHPRTDRALAAIDELREGT